MLLDSTLLINSEIKVIDQPEILLHDLFAESTIQIGVYSTALFEGLAFGLRTFLVDTKGVEVMESLLSGGLVKKVSSADDLLRQIKETEPSAAFDYEYFFKSNALENISEFLDRYL